MRLNIDPYTHTIRIEPEDQHERFQLQEFWDLNHCDCEGQKLYPIIFGPQADDPAILIVMPAAPDYHEFRRHHRQFNPNTR